MIGDNSKAKKKSSKVLKLLLALVFVAFIAIIVSPLAALFRYHAIAGHTDTNSQQQHRFFLPQDALQEPQEPQWKLMPEIGSPNDNNNHITAAVNLNVDDRVKAYANASPPSLSNGIASLSSSSDYCLDEDCIRQTASTIARAFARRTNKSTWCLPARPGPGRGYPFRGILLTKVPKGASSTSAGVAIRIAARHSCGAIEWKHRLASEFQSSDNNNNPGYIPEQSFLFTTVREPAARSVSTVFFHIVSRYKKLVTPITDAFLIQTLKVTNHSHMGTVSNGQGGFQLRYTSLHEIPENSAWTNVAPQTVLNPAAVIRNVQNVIQAYDFILVPERMDESLTAMALLLGLDVGDVLVTSSKVAGGSRYHLVHPNRTTWRCVPTVKSKISPTVQDFLRSDTWRAMNYGDYLLHEAASQSLDLTIERSIGHERFDVALKRYRRLRLLEQSKCAPTVKFPCSDAGQPQTQIAEQNCYLPYYDFGCGYPCIDQLIADDADAATAD